MVDVPFYKASLMKSKVVVVVAEAFKVIIDHVRSDGADHIDGMTKCSSSLRSPPSFDSRARRGRQETVKFYNFID